MGPVHGEPEPPKIGVSNQGGPNTTKTEKHPKALQPKESHHYAELISVNAETALYRLTPVLSRWYNLGLTEAEGEEEEHIHTVPAHALSSPHNALTRCNQTVSGK